MLVIEGTGQHGSKGYIYSAMDFSLFVQMLNLRMDRKRREREVSSQGPAGPGDGAEAEAR